MNIQPKQNNNQFREVKSETEKCYNYAIYLLSLKLRTEGEVSNRLQVKSYKPDTINRVIKQLKDNRYLDDEKYAEVYVENLKAYKNFGFYGIKKKLMEKKLPTTIIERILRSNLTVADELVVAKKYMKKEKFVVKTKSPSEEGESSYSTFNEVENKEKQKIMNRLKSRGFRGDVISKLLN